MYYPPSTARLIKNEIEEQAAYIRSCRQYPIKNRELDRKCIRNAISRMRILKTALLIAPEENDHV